ncbi:MAG: hypothetical protein M3Y06_07860 [Actinomycetota bacterium]|nr:hypothetical protein [Actinomycetota bacterium]
MDTPSTSIGPGLGAFVAFFGLAVILWLLMRNMNGRMRRMAYHEQQRVAEIEARQTQDPPVKRKRKRAELGMSLVETGHQEPVSSPPGASGSASDEPASDGQDVPDDSTPTP